MATGMQPAVIDVPWNQPAGRSSIGAGSQWARTNFKPDQPRGQRHRHGAAQLCLGSSGFSPWRFPT